MQAGQGTNFEEPEIFFSTQSFIFIFHKDLTGIHCHRNTKNEKTGLFLLFDLSEHVQWCELFKRNFSHLLTFDGVKLLLQFRTCFDHYTLI